MIRCRAKVSQGCLDGTPEFDVYGSVGGDMEDGTWDAATGTIVCTPCYIVLMPLTPSGQGLNRELPEAIRRAKETR